MKLFAPPQTTTLADGSVRIDIQAITLEYINNRIITLETVGKLDIDEVIYVIRKSKNTLDGINNLVSQFEITEDVAGNLIDMELSVLSKYLNGNDFRIKEISRWKALKVIFE